MAYHTCSPSDRRLALLVLGAGEPDRSAAINQAAVEYGTRVVLIYLAVAAAAVAAGAFEIMLIGLRAAIVFVVTASCGVQIIRVARKRRGLQTHLRERARA